MKWCLDYLLEEKEEWENKLIKVKDLISDLAILVKEDYTTMLQIKYHKIQKERYSKFVRDNLVQVENFQTQNYEKNKSKSNKIQSAEFYSKVFGKFPFYVENTTLLHQINWIPTLVQETFKKTDKSRGRRMSSINKGVQLEALYNLEKDINIKDHLIVLIHGDNGCHKDMKLYRRFIGMILPNSLCLSAKSLKNYKNKCIIEMAKDLANEIIYTVKKQGNIGHISFIAHTLGGIVVRAALPFLESLKENMNTFLSLGTPHLGQGISSQKNILESSKIFFWGGLMTNKFEDQLQMKDTNNLRDSFLYQLAVNDRLHWFKNIILVDSDDHSKVSTASARIENVGNQEVLEIKEITNEMARLIWAQVKNDVIVRVDVDLENPYR